MAEDTIEYVWAYCPECDEEYLVFEDDQKCPICNCECDLL